MTNEQIKAIFLAAGFKEKEQGDGRIDLSRYVYNAARDLLTMQLAELGWFPCSPRLLGSGVDCATAPRLLGGQGVSHYHRNHLEADWYEHALCDEEGRPFQFHVTRDQAPAFGRPGVNYGTDYSVTVKPLYTHADPAEVERLRLELANCTQAFHALKAGNESLRTQLAEAQALLREIAHHCNGCVMPTEQLLRDWGSSIDAHLSASAEPSAPVELCNICKGYGKYQDSDSGTDEDGRCPNIVECECDDSERMPQYRSSAPVEREAVEVEAYLVRDKEVPKHRGVRLFVDPSCYNVNTETLPLMTVAQHERIVAALERR